MNCNHEIRHVGSSVDIVDTYEKTSMYYGHIGPIAGKTNMSPEHASEAGFYLPTDCGVQSGYILKYGEIYMLVVTIKPVYYMGDLLCYRGMLIECNSLVRVYHFNRTNRQHDILYKSDVRCYINQQYSRGLNLDIAYVIPQFLGRLEPFTFAAQESSGINEDCVVEDSDNHRFRVSKDYDVFTADGVIIGTFAWEK